MWGLKTATVISRPRCSSATNARRRRWLQLLQTERARLTHSVPHVTGSLKARLAIHCCFVDVLVELRVSSIVSHQWVCTHDIPLPSFGSRWPRFPAVIGTMRMLRLLTCVPSAYLFASRYRGALPGVCAFACALPPSGQRRTAGRGQLFSAGIPFPAVYLPRTEQDLPGSLAVHPMTLRRSTTPDDPLYLAISGASDAAWATREPDSHLLPVLLFSEVGNLESDRRHQSCPGYNFVVS